MPEQFFHFLVGILYFVLMLLLEMVLPAWAGDENGIIENLQLLWLLGGFVYCLKIARQSSATGAEIVFLCGMPE